MVLDSLSPPTEVALGQLAPPPLPWASHRDLGAAKVEGPAVVGKMNGVPASHSPFPLDLF